jgi:hypothetical protein
MACQRPWGRPGRKLPAKSTATEVMGTQRRVRRQPRPRESQRLIRPDAGHTPPYGASLIYTRWVKKPAMIPGNTYPAIYLGFTAASARQISLHRDLLSLALAHVLAAIVELPC